MIKLIKNMIKKEKALENEVFYINQINLIMKKYWRMSLNESDAVKEIRKYLNKLDLCEENHPFLIQYRDELNYAVKYEPYNIVKIDKLHRSLFIYRNKIIKDNQLKSI